MTIAAPSPPATRPLWRRILFNAQRLRAGWRLLLLVLWWQACEFLLQGAVTLALRALHLRISEAWTPVTLGTFEALSAAAAFSSVWILSRVDRLPFSAYGLTRRGAFGARFWEGTAWGFVTVGVLVGAIAALGGYHAHGATLAGGGLVRAAVLWAIVMVLVGLSEELLFRGGAQRVLTDGLGFWPAAVLLSAAFGAVHYFLKPMENLTDAASVALIGLFVCLTLRRTGTLWFAIGYHFAFDFAALALFGAPNSGNNGRPVVDHLVNGTFAGPAWLTGGPLGIEASLLVFPLLALTFALFVATHRRVRAG